MTKRCITGSWVAALLSVGVFTQNPLFAQTPGGAATPVKRLYIANDDHTDYMWTANEARYDSAYVRLAREAAKRWPKYPPFGTKPCP